MKLFAGAAALEAIRPQEGGKQILVLEQSFSQIAAVPKHRDRVVEELGMALERLGNFRMRGQPAVKAIQHPVWVGRICEQWEKDSQQIRGDARWEILQACLRRGEIMKRNAAGMRRELQGNGLESVSIAR